MSLVSQQKILNTSTVLSSVYCTNDIIFNKKTDQQNKLVSNSLLIAWPSSLSCTFCLTSKARHNHNFWTFQTNQFARPIICCRQKDKSGVDFLSLLFKFATGLDTFLMKNAVVSLLFCRQLLWKHGRRGCCFLPGLAKIFQIQSFCVVFCSTGLSTVWCWFWLVGVAVDGSCLLLLVRCQL